MTRILIAHRTSTVADADVVVVPDAGRVVTVDRPDALAALAPA